jgi:hypothetical protein
MARHAIDADTAFEMLRDHSQHNGRRLADIAAAIIDSHLLLPPPPLPRPSNVQQQTGGKRAANPPELVV